jgi:hypothetical protein
MATIREQIKGDFGGGAPPGSSWLVRLIWALIDLDLPALEEADVDIADVIWGNGHTISWNLGKLVVAGDPVAIEICLILADFMGPEHCKNAYINGT